MSSRPGRLFVGRLPRTCRENDMRKVFETYGKLSRCDVKTGPESNYGFVDFEDRRDAADAIHYEDGRDLLGQRIVVEWAKATPRGGRDHDDDRDRYRRRSPARRRYSDRDRSYSRERDRRAPLPRRSRSPSRERYRRNSYRDREDRRDDRKRRSRSSDRST